MCAIAAPLLVTPLSADLRRVGFLFAERITSQRQGGRHSRSLISCWAPLLPEILMRVKLFLLVALSTLLASSVIQTSAVVAQETPPTPQDSVPGAQPAGSTPATPAMAQTSAHFDGN